MTYTEYISILLVSKHSSSAVWSSDNKHSLLQHPSYWPMRENKRIMLGSREKSELILIISAVIKAFALD